jgi:hypothetical protein
MSHTEPIINRRLEWTAIGLSGEARDERDSEHMTIQACPQRPFRGVYLIVNSPGWFIHRASVGNRIFLESVHGDTYSRDEHDRLERMGQLERHRIGFSLEVGNVLTVVVSRRCIPTVCGERETVVAALAGAACVHTHPCRAFDATVIGVCRRE